MSTQAELWSENRVENHYEVLGGMLRDELIQEKTCRIDASYLGHVINQWWQNRSKWGANDIAKSQLRLLILKTLQPDHLSALRSVGSIQTRLAAVFLERTFSLPSKELALLVHEVLSDIVGIIDLKYPYEDHKELFPQNSDTLASDWGRGLGVIRPHSDDLYESRAITIMSLTVYKDTSSTPTWFWFPYDLTSCLTDEELGYLALSHATFLSGANVKGKTISVVKPVLRRDSKEGIGLRLDFRIDDEVGERMRLTDPRAQQIFDKIRANLKSLRPICSNPSSGSFSVLANHKVLHGRSALDSACLTEGESSRILFRSKGIQEKGL